MDKFTPWVLEDRGDGKYYGTIIKAGDCNITLWGDYRNDGAKPSSREKGYYRPYLSDDGVDIEGNHYEDQRTLDIAYQVLAAPEMLAALEYVFASGQPLLTGQAIKRMQAAIAKARGEA